MSDQACGTIDDFNAKEEGLELSGLKVLVVGLGVTGISAARFLSERGALVTATDLRTESELDGTGELRYMGASIICGGHDVSAASGMELIVVSPGVPSRIPLLNDARENGVEVISEIELASRFIKEPIIAVTGTNGKTTTTTLIGEVLRRGGKSVFVGGNIGTPAIDYVIKGEKKDYCVLEVSSFHLETIKTFRPKVAIVLNITEDHLYRYRDFDDYARTKFSIFSNQGAGDTAIVNISDPVIARELTECKPKGRVLPFSAEGEISSGDGIFMRDGRVVLRLDGIEEEYADFSGVRTSMENIMATIGAARLLNIDTERVEEAVGSFKGLRHRLELVREASGVKYINDSKATNIGSVVEALRVTQGPVVLIAGGVDKGGDYTVLRELVREKVRLLILTGEAKFKINEAIGDITPTVLVSSLAEGVKAAVVRAKDGDTVLLSPACSSFDEFSSFEERGDRFRKLVEVQ
ncbi:MAG: UDP-N-acetylmuramoyl-L-alanine--D-glutamate ligase [Thermodesulfobacteriota bacterium]